MKALADTLQAMKPNAASSVAPTTGLNAMDGNVIINLQELRETSALALQGKNTPTSVDQNLKAILTSHKNLSASLSSLSRYDENGKYLGENVLVENIKPSTDLLKAVKFLCSNTDTEIIMREVYGMWTVMAKRAEDGTDFKSRQAIYADELNKYPQDIVIHVCRKARSTWKFLPTLSEIVLECEKYFSFRKSLLNALQKSMTTPPAIEKNSHYREVPRGKWQPHNFLQKIQDCEIFSNTHKKYHSPTDELEWLLLGKKFCDEAHEKFSNQNYPEIPIIDEIHSGFIPRISVLEARLRQLPENQPFQTTC